MHKASFPCQSKIKKYAWQGIFYVLISGSQFFMLTLKIKPLSKRTMLLRILGYLCQLCFIIGLYYGLKSQEAFLQYTVCILAMLILIQRIFIDLFWKKENT